jgi:hypothetical protein
MRTHDRSPSVVPTNNEGLAKAALEMANRIEKLDMSFVFEKLLWDGELDESEHELAEQEFKRFIFLVGLGIAPLAMISPKIDLVWHQFVLFTQSYDRFCRGAVGIFVHHTPETPTAPIPLVAATNFLDSYERYWGALPSIWLDSLGDDLRTQYLARPLQEKPNVRWSGWTGRADEQIV